MTRLCTMKQVKVGKGAIGKEFWHTASFEQGQRRRKGGCMGFKLNEENSRFCLLAFCLLIYLTFGAVVFHFLEYDNELVEKKNYSKTLNDFKLKYCSNFYVNCTALDELLDLRGNMSAAGLIFNNTKWDFAGAFHFVGTLVSTIGFGTTIPRTNLGRLFTVFYGFGGCAAGILFFNLFLERIITILAYMLRFINDKNIFPKCTKTPPTPEVRAIKTPDSDDFQSEVSLPSWKPPVTSVFTCLFFFAVLLILIAASVYHYVEEWTYLEAVYFCFASFATVGFGDFVPGQQWNKQSKYTLYTIANGCFLTIGCCFVYSLFNVTSIVIRQFLNKIIRSLTCECRRPPCCRKKRHRYLGLGLRPPDPDDISDSEKGPTDGIISLKEFLEQNKMNIFLMQKHLVESVQQQQRTAHIETTNSISANSVGPLAMLTQKFGED